MTAQSAAIVELVAWWLALWGLRIVAGLLFAAMAFGWAVSLLYAAGRFRWVGR